MDKGRISFSLRSPKSQHRPKTAAIEVIKKPSYSSPAR